MSKVCALYHIVFGTKHRESTINPEHAEDMYRFIWRILTDHNCYMMRINSMPDHVHILIGLDPKTAIADIVAKIKAQSSGWMRQSGKFPLFKGWCNGYFASTIGYNDRQAVIDYIKYQQTHHNQRSYTDEMQALYLKYGLSWNSQDLQ